MITSLSITLMRTLTNLSQIFRSVLGCLLKPSKSKIQTSDFIMKSSNSTNTSNQTRVIKMTEKWLSKKSYRFYKTNLKPVR